MNTFHSILAAFAAVTVLLAGCAKSGNRVDPAPVEKSFATAEPTLKASADKAVAAIKNADYSSALAELQKLAANVKLTEEQKKGINDVLSQVQKAIADMGNKAAGEANKTLDGLNKSLGK